MTAPPPRDIVDRETGRLVGFACRRCGAFYAVPKEANEEETACLKETVRNHCEKFCACGAALEQYRIRCGPCQHKVFEEQQRARAEKAEKVSIDQYHDPVYWDGGRGDMGGDHYFSSVEAVLDHCEDEELEVPAYVWACKKEVFALDAYRVVEHQLERQDFSDADEEYVSPAAMKQLQDFFDIWSKEQDVSGWWQDQSRVVVIDQALNSHRSQVSSG